MLILDIILSQSSGQDYITILTKISISKTLKDRVLVAENKSEIADDPFNKFSNFQKEWSFLRVEEVASKFVDEQALTLY